MWSLNYLRSRGRARLRSADPHALPRIQYNLLQDLFDRSEIVRAYRLLRSLLARAPLAKVIGPMLRPTPEPQTDAEIVEFVRNATQTAYHHGGTCRMGCDLRAVVDGSLRVRGVEGLRVVDASIFPTLPGGNTNLPVMMVASERSSPCLP